MRSLNRKGDEKIIALYWFLIFVIIAIGVSSGVILFYGNSLDLRQKEASILVDRVIDCYATNGNLNSNFNTITTEATLESDCNLYFADATEPSYSGTDQYYVDVTIPAEKYSEQFGNTAISTTCDAAVSAKNRPICYNETMILLGSNGEPVEMNVMAGVEKLAQNEH